MLGCCQGWLIYLLLMLVHVEIQVHLRQSASWLKMCVLSLSGLQVRIYFLQYCINTVKCCCVFTSKLCLLQNNVSFITNNDCNRSCGSIMLKKRHVIHSSVSLFSQDRFQLPGTLGSIMVVQITQLYPTCHFCSLKGTS